MLRNTNLEKRRQEKFEEARRQSERTVPWKGLRYEMVHPFISKSIPEAISPGLKLTARVQ